MNVDDPFANDLNNFRTVVAGLRRQASSSPMGSSFGHGLGGGTSDASPLLSFQSTSGPLGAASSVQGAGSPIFSSGASGVSLFPSASNAAPVAGRRARGTLSASSPLSAAPSSVPPSSESGAHPLSVSHQRTQLSVPLTQAPPLASAVTTTLSWLDYMESVPPPQPQAAAAHRQGLPPLSTSPPTSFTAAAGNVLSFLNFGDADGAGSTTPPPAHETTFQPETSPAPAAAAAEAEKKRAELRDLYATLDALDMEQQRLDERLDTRQLKEETALLALETSVKEKANELVDKEEELATKHTELASRTAERLEALSSRYTRETEAQSTEVRSLDGARLEKQLQQVRSQRTAAENEVKILRERAALALAMEPFSERGIRVALSATAPTSSAASDHAGASDGEGDTAPSASLEMRLQKSVDLLRAYCDQRLHHARAHLVDYVHAETLEAAHAVRRTREQLWADDAVQHKTLFNQYLTDMMQRYMLFYKERALLKQQNISSLQEEIRSTAAELRSNAAARLAGLLKDVTAKMTLSESRLTKSAEEAKSELQRKCAAVVETDVAMAITQRKELESRQLVEAQARRQRFRAEEQSLLDQLQRLRRSSETAAHGGFQSLLDSVGPSGLNRAQTLDEEVAALKGRVHEKLLGGGASSSSELRAASSAAHMHAEELVHVIRRALAETAAQQPSLTLSRQRCDELRRELLHGVGETVIERLQHARCVQHAHQSRIDAQRKTWEAAHRQNLAAACSLVLPISGSTAKTGDAQYVAETYAAPQDVTSIALMDLVRDKLQSRDDARRHLLQSRKECATRCFRLLDDIHARQEAVRTTWEDLWGAAQTLLTQQAASHEAQLEVERGLITVEALQQTVTRDRRNTERECRRIADATQRINADAAQIGVDARLLCAPPELLEAEGEAVAVVPPPLPSTSTFLHAVDPSVINSLSNGNLFTAVHTSTNVAAGAYNKTENSKPATSSPAPSAAPMASQPPLAPTLRSADSETKPGPPRPTPQQGDSSHIVNCSNATATQPWSSALLQAEQLQSSPNTEEAHIATEEPSPLGPTAQDERRGGAVGVGRVTSVHLSGGEEGKQGSSSSGRSRSSARCEGSKAASSASPTTTIEERHHSSSSLPSAEILSQLGPSTWLDTDTGWQQRLRAPSSSRWHLQRPQGRTPTTFGTFSALEEFHSGVDRSASAMRDQDTSGEGTPFSFDDSNNFVDLLSCTDSPASSYRTR
ncbi:hypothetical protein ABB37_07818 [Leptomonas pyrrhocoris]|uniref:Uncharacterized protein n=1 Tax=Leptomonas pyrrhocoris TaxID=157538 RepID=A0A0M9FUX5_LEPPY|nr:hypothetical protein ABB37_07818 [Leptomonas pyrrhocoris]KPA76523.1 hypothetical protein ABB37_07818 [Leptomonas pyrrhocoris]|eukprot:XP_015654962.1 hypothetical protein ABB37_07818 [Leptomonas pyrrhocoris]